MNMQFEYMANDDRTDPRDMSRPWGRLTATTDAGTSIIEATLWPDGRHVLKIRRRTKLGADGEPVERAAGAAPQLAVVTAAQLAEFARMVESTAKGCAGDDAAEMHGVELADKAARIRAALWADAVMGTGRLLPEHLLALRRTNQHMARTLTNTKGSTCTSTSIEGAR